MPNPDALVRHAQALAAIDVMMRGGKGGGGRLVEMAREARQAAEGIATAKPALPAPAGGVDAAERI